MNEKIKELAEIANGVALAEFNDVSLRKFRLYSEIYDDKFAELIIKECTDTIIKAYGGHINPKIAIEAINNHFGVE